MSEPAQPSTDIYGQPAPPVIHEPSPHHGKNGRKAGEAAGAVGIGALILSKLAGIGKFFLIVVKFLKLGKILTTGGSMFISMWLYATVFGWPFAAGFVILIFIHEMGHVFVAWRQGLPITAPVFIPFMGAIIFERRASKTAWEQAWMGIGGPIGGTLGALACWAIYASTNNALFLGLAYIGFFLNLFNLAPVFPLDGGWIVGAISPWIWVVGMVGLVVAIFTGNVHNPMLIILVILGLPHAWRALRSGGAVLGAQPASLGQKIVMGLSYVGLAAFLTWAMVATHIERPDLHPSAPQRPPQTVYSLSPSKGLLHHHELG